MPGTNYLKEELFIEAQGFRGSGPLGFIYLGKTSQERWVTEEILLLTMDMKGKGEDNTEHTPVT